MNTTTNTANAASRITIAKGCIAHEPGMTLWDCECRECARLQDGDGGWDD